VLYPPVDQPACSLACGQCGAGWPGDKEGASCSRQLRSQTGWTANKGPTEPVLHQRRLGWVRARGLSRGGAPITSHGEPRVGERTDFCLAVLLSFCRLSFCALSPFASGDICRLRRGRGGAESSPRALLSRLSRTCLLGRQSPLHASRILWRLGRAENRHREHRPQITLFLSCLGSKRVSGRPMGQHTRCIG
jgi:hypothetical protein